MYSACVALGPGMEGHAIDRDDGRQKETGRERGRVWRGRENRKEMTENLRRLKCLHCNFNPLRGLLSDFFDAKMVLYKGWKVPCTHIHCDLRTKSEPIVYIIHT